MWPNPSILISTMYSCTHLGSRVRALLPGFWPTEPRQNLEVRHLAQQAPQTSRVHYQHHLPLYVHWLRQNGQRGLPHGGLRNNNPRLLGRKSIWALQRAQVGAIPWCQLRLMQLQVHCTFAFIQLLDCLRGLDYAMKLGWFDYKKFNLKEYEHF